MGLFQTASVLKRIITMTGADAENPVNWLVDLDLQMYRAGLMVMSCVTWSMYEGDYLTRVTLTESLSQNYQIEVAKFRERHFERCLPGANWFQVAQKGLVAPWCFRRDV